MIDRVKILATLPKGQAQLEMFSSWRKEPLEMFPPSSWHPTCTQISKCPNTQLFVLTVGGTFTSFWYIVPHDKYIVVDAWLVESIATPTRGSEHNLRCPR